ncbi:LAFA_0F08922g1_1 [Lachancea sp. 'fantastica']|nr:LAFA_0F08922g1_1 [Lachancea sp. 'fantastica']
MSEQTSTLASLFPDVSEQVLTKTLESANGDVEMASNMILSEQDSLSQLRNVAEISELDFEKHNEPSKQDKGAVNLKKRLYRRVHSFDDIKRPNDKAKACSQNQFWSSTQEQIRSVVDLTAVPHKIGQTAFYKKSLNAGRAAIDIVSHYDDYLAEFHKSRSPIPPPVSAQPARVGGRVQSAQGLAHQKEAKTGFQEQSKPSGSDQSSTAPYPRNVATAQELLKASRELEAIVASNPVLKAISPQFFKLALEFYGADVARTTTLAAFIIENDCSRYTFTDTTTSFVSAGTLSPRSHKTSSVINPAAQPGPEGELGAVVPESESFSSDNSYNQALQIFEAIFQTHTADLHGFYPQEAKQIAQNCLTAWWSRETSLREMNAHRPNLIKALNVAPLKIITGRGIHSLGGVSKVKIQIKKLLDSENYVYTEEPSYFIVDGRRTQVRSRKR